ncbi:MAG: ribose transport system permease protein [Kiritimatiellia bacterium]|jgi:ribose transport system permease protein
MNIPTVFIRFKEWWLLVGMVLLATAITNGIYIQPANLTDMLRSIAPIGVMAMAMTFVILAAGIDLSVGSMLALASVGTAVLLVDVAPDWPPALAMCSAVVASLVIGGIIGALQGGLIARLEIQPFIITLAGMIGVRGLAKLWSQNNRIGLGIDRDSAAHAFGEAFSSKPVMIGLLVVVALLFHIVLTYTVFGRNVRAVGDNEQAARYAGLPVHRVKLMVYALSGMMAGLAGLMLCARTRNGDANLGVAYELDAIAMVVIGGTSLAGGRGTVGGTVLGALIMGTVINVLGLKNIDANVQFILKAVIIVVAVALQRSQKKN